MNTNTQPRVTVYTTGAGCVRCTLTKRRLEEKGITPVEVDIRDNPAARQYVTETLGYASAPVVVVDDGTTQDHWYGFRPDLIDQLAASLA